VRMTDNMNKFCDNKRYNGTDRGTDMYTGRILV